MIRAFAVLVSLMSTCWFAGSALAEEGDPTDARARAGAHYQRGLSFVDQERWAEALGEFEAAMEIDPHQATLFNLAHCLSLLGRHVEAARAFEEHLDRFGGEVSPERRGEVASQLADLAPRVGRIDPRVTGPERATVLVDSEEQGTTPLRRPIVVGPGHHVVLMRADGYQDARREVELRGGETARLEIALEPETVEEVEPPVPAPIPQPPVEEPVPDDDRSRGLVIAGWVLSGLGVVALGTGVALFGAASSQFSDWESRNEILAQEFAEASGPSDVEGLWEDVSTNDDLHDSIRGLDTGGWVLVGTGVASLIAGVALLIVGYRARPNTQVSLVPRPGGMTFGLSWGGSAR